jgi:hypothetical protein
MDENIPVHYLAVKSAINAINDLIRYPDNNAAKVKARLAAEVLEGYLPENIEKARKEAEG